MAFGGEVGGVVAHEAGKVGLPGFGPALFDQFFEVVALFSVGPRLQS